MDQIAAQALGRDTQLTSLELCLDSNELIGACEAGYSCAYANTLSWRNPTTPLPMENQPRAVFERLFGDSDNTTKTARLARIQDDRSILDSLIEEVQRCGGGSGPRYRPAQHTSTPFAISSGGFRRPRNRSTSSCRRWSGRAAASRRRLPSMRG